MGEEIPRKRGLGLTRSDILVINKTALAPYVDVSIDNMRKDTEEVRDGKPFVFADLKSDQGVNEIVALIKDLGGI